MGKRASTYLKMRVLGAIDAQEGRTRQERIAKVAKMVFEENAHKFSFTHRTISTWYYRFKVNGITEMLSKIRSDKGRSRKVNPEELLEAINKVKDLFHQGKTPNLSVLYRLLIEKGFLRKEKVAYNTFTRLVRKFDLLEKESELPAKRLAFAMPHANDLWQGDTMVGPFVKNEQGKSIQARLILFLDDASRVVCHGQFFFSENTDNLMETLRQAFFKRGIPKQIYVDNGSIYCSQELTLLCARIGCILGHTPVRDGAAKGKVERFFRTVREQFLVRELDLSSLKSLNRQFHTWVEEEYNSRHHSILGLSPVDRFTLDHRTIEFLSPSDTSEELFYAEKTCKVLMDNTFRFAAKRYETPVHLAGKLITIRFHRLRKDRVVVFYKETRMGEAKEVDFIANATMRRPHSPHKNGRQS